VEEIREVVDTNDKKRFTIKEFETSEGVREFIRANQGHSVKSVKVDMEKIVSVEGYPTIIHGTNAQAWNLISKDPRGLSRMNRNHIHFATGLLGQDGVISGMRQSCTVLIYVNLQQALDSGVEFFKSENGVVLTAGVDNKGYLPKEFFKRVVTNKGNVLWEPAV
jgi:2'-phosphotransferase